MEIKHLQLIRERLSYKSVKVCVLVPGKVLWVVVIEGRGVFRRVRREKYGVPFHQAETPRTLIKLQENVTTADTFH